jgi:hypothetical protein
MGTKLTSFTGEVSPDKKVIHFQESLPLMLFTIIKSFTQGKGLQLSQLKQQKDKSLMMSELYAKSYSHPSADSIKKKNYHRNEDL